MLRDKSIVSNKFCIPNPQEYDYSNISYYRRYIVKFEKELFTLLFINRKKLKECEQTILIIRVLIINSKQEKSFIFSTLYYPFSN